MTAPQGWTPLVRWSVAVFPPSDPAALDVMYAHAPSRAAARLNAADAAVVMLLDAQCRYPDAQVVLSVVVDDDLLIAEGGASFADQALLDALLDVHEPGRGDAAGPT